MVGRWDSDCWINAYEHLPREPRAQEALHTLRKIASLVKPIMRKRGWRVGTLTEFFPGQANLLGLNVDRGRKICLRLRHAGDREQFMPLDNVVDTMLHELCHIVFGPHDEHFHRLWNELRDEYTDLVVKGYTGEGFLSDGHRLGGSRMPMHEMRRQARVAAEKRKTLQKNSGSKLGGRPILRSLDIRAVIAEAAQRRSTITQGCASGTRDSVRIAEEASQNGFRTKAEEDAANEQAINDALWELVQEDEARKAGLDPTSYRTEGLIWNPQTGLELPPPVPPESPILKRSSPPITRKPVSTARTEPAQTYAPYRGVANPSGPTSAPAPPSIPNRSKPLPPPPPPSDVSSDYGSRKSNVSMSSSGRPMSRLVAEAEDRKKRSSLQQQQQQKRAKPVDSPSSIYSPIPNSRLSADAAAPLMDLSSYDDEFNPGAGPTVTRSAASAFAQQGWQCSVCTLFNRMSYLCCEACGTQRPSAEVPSTVDLDAEIALLQRQSSAAFVASQQPPSELPAVSRPAKPRSTTTTSPPPPDKNRLGWTCTACGAFMEKQWWSCSGCSKMKERWQ